MPELPEVETTLRGITPHIHQQTVAQIIIRQPRLRWPVPLSLTQELPGQKMLASSRRGKYLLLHYTQGTLIVHLGMSGSLRILTETTAAKTHDHVDIIFTNKVCLRYTDPRRFGCVLWTNEALAQHPLLEKLGPEPLTAEFNGDYLYQQAQARKTPIKTFIMDGQIVVGVGNIYANEALFLAGIHPKRQAGKINLASYKKLVHAIKKILAQAIKQGGTTLRNFSQSDGKPGYFKQKLKVYGRGKLPCVKCSTPLREIRQGQRTTVYCPSCQK